MAALATLEVEECGLTTRTIQQISSSLHPDCSLVKLCIGESLLTFFSIWVEVTMYLSYNQRYDCSFLKRLESNSSDHRTRFTLSTKNENHLNVTVLKGIQHELACTVIGNEILYRVRQFFPWRMEWSCSLRLDAGRNNPIGGSALTTLFQKLSTLIRYMLVLFLSAPSYIVAPAQENNSHSQIVHENSIAPNKISKDRVNWNIDFRVQEGPVT